jgi:hypothetical protein
MNAREVNKLLGQVNKEKLRVYLAEQILLSSILKRQVNRSLLRYVDKKLNGENAVLHTRKQQHRNGRCIVRRQQDVTI